MDCMQQKQIERRLRHILCRPNRQGKGHERHHPVQHNAQQHRTGSQGVEVVVAAVCWEYRRFHRRAEETLIGAVKKSTLAKAWPRLMRNRRAWIVSPVVFQTDRLFLSEVRRSWVGLSWPFPYLLSVQACRRYREADYG